MNDKGDIRDFATIEEAPGMTTHILLRNLARVKRKAEKRRRQRERDKEQEKVWSRRKVADFWSEVDEEFLKEQGETRLEYQARVWRQSMWTDEWIRGEARLQGYDKANVRAMGRFGRNGKRAQLKFFRNSHWKTP